MYNTCGVVKLCNMFYPNAWRDFGISLWFLNCIFILILYEGVLISPLPNLLPDVIGRN